MRVNVYAEEMTDRVEIIEKQVGENKFTALRFYLALPTTFVPTAEQGLQPATIESTGEMYHFKAPFIHHPGDDDSAAVTFWGKQDLRVMLRKALAALDAHYETKDRIAEMAKIGVGRDGSGC